MKLFYAPGACSIGIHLLMEEIGKPYETHKFILSEGEHSRPPFTDINPKGKVPALQRDDGTVLTEYPVIARWLAEPNGLWPSDADTALHAAETMQFCVGTIHPQGFTRMFRPANFNPDESKHDAVRAQGRELLAKQFAVLSKALGDRPFIAGDRFSAADTAMFYVELWAAHWKIDLPANLQAHFDRLRARPATGRVMAAEGLAA